ncbi:protein-ADP-ribose hydrolase [Staphylococcus xylosus]|uniref:protein-ADP-ribose hydrolase n=1 Tax=Staphylococcus xylosus TaxID=1288 RepID=UPI0011A958BC|nr:protein-ADP-ribose hydrolase [Staphylococcus xylosus]MCE7785227.1 protein-ADP-ribose hydrolase [Staphylococcus xylosus]
MQQVERLAYLIEYLWQEENGDKILDLPDTEQARWDMFRSLINVRPAKDISKDFIDVQDALLIQYNNQKVTDITSLTPYLGNDIYLWQGDITQLQVDGIVNAANSQFLGCFEPNHNCIDNIIHTKAGVQLRLACAELIERQGKREGVGKAKITGAYNLPANYVIHTVGPQVRKTPVSRMNRDLLARCYQSCLEIADAHQLASIAFCCISTGVFGFPQAEASRIAIDTVLNYKRTYQSDINVVFNVFTDTDLKLYKKGLKQND